MSFFKKHPNWTAFLLSLLIGLLIILPSMISGKGVFTFIDDYNQQEIPFNTELNESIKSGNNLFEFKNDLGSDFIGSYSFYNVGSPFAMVLWLFPADAVPYLMGIMYAVKFAIAGLTSYMFLSRFVKNKKYALLGSLLYAFSGFQFANMIFYHFHDSVALFPLLLYGLDRLIKEDKKGIFALAVAVNLFTNYFFFIGQVVFVLIYYLVMHLTKHYNFSIKKFGKIVFESLIGVGIGAIILLPSIDFVLANPRIEGDWTIFSMLVPQFNSVLEVFRSLLFPNDSMTFHSVINMMNYGSVEAYLPFVGTILWFTYMFKKPKNPFSILMMVLFVFMLIPILNSSFFAFTPVYYARWFYMATLIMSLLSIKALDEKMDIKPGIIATFIALGIYFILSFIFAYSGQRYFYQSGLFLVALIVLLINILVILFNRKSKHFDKILLMGVCIYAVIYGNYFCFSNRIMHQDQDNLVGRYNEVKSTLSDLEKNVRYNHDNSCERNMLYHADKMSISSWNSNIEGNAFVFYESIGISRNVETKIDTGQKDLQNFLSVKYLVSCGGNQEDYEKEYKKVKQNGNINVYENKDYLPFGIDYTYYISKNKYDSLSNEEKKNVLNHAVVLTEEQILKYSDILKEYNNETRKTIISSSTFETHKKGFTSTINSEQDSFIIYTFPYNKNWIATVNKREVTIENIDNGLMGIPILKGENVIEFSYKPIALKLGTVVSISSLVLFGGYMIIKRKKEEK